MHEHTRLEQRLFSVLLSFPEELDTLELPVSAFSTPAHQAFYTALHKAWTKHRAVDYTIFESVATEQGLDKKEIFDIFSQSIVHDALGAPQPIADKIHENYSRREMSKVAAALHQAAQAPAEDPQKAIHGALTAFYHVLGGNGHDGIENASDGLLRLLEKLSAIRAGELDIDLIYTGFIDLDRILGGIERGRLIYLAARPGMGKSALGGAIAASIASRGGHVIYISREMSNEQQYMRWGATKAKVSTGKVRDPRLMSDAEWKRVQDGMTALKDAFEDRMHIGFVGLTPLKLEAMIRKYQRQHGRIEAVIVDRIELMQSDTGMKDDYARITDISVALKQVALDTGVPLIVMTQLNRKVEDRADKRPAQSDLRNTGSLEQDADIVMFIYRDAYYNGDTSPAHHPSGAEIAEIIVAKNRDGGTGTAQLLFTPEFVRFANLAREAMQ